MQQLMVKASSKQYNVHIGEDSFTLFKTDYVELLESADSIAIIADEYVAKLHLPKLLESLKELKSKVVVKTVPAGEKCKTSTVYMECQSFLLQKGFTRNSLLIAFGGGACGDLTGFVAATYMRGISYIQCPSTILAHDSAVGGKTAINLPEGKNMVGAFHQPVAVIFNSMLFETLPPREIRSGLAELLKHAFISNSDWSYRLLMTGDFTNPTKEWLEEELLKGIQVKAAIVAEDEFEQSTRMYLNFGHTFGHAVEAVCGFGGLSHGESIMIGMAYSLILSESIGGIDRRFTNDFIEFLTKNSYSFKSIREHSFESFLSFMVKDKKATHGHLNFVLLEKLGIPVVSQVSRNDCRDAFEQLRARTEGVGE